MLLPSQDNIYSSLQSHADMLVSRNTSRPLLDYSHSPHTPTVRFIDSATVPRSNASLTGSLLNRNVFSIMVYLFTNANCLEVSYANVSKEKESTAQGETENLPDFLGDLLSPKVPVHQACPWMEKINK